MSPLPSISFVTPSYNQARFIRDTIESVLALGLTDFEHIVMDGGSNDGTVEILKEYPHLIWVSEKDKGQSDALNKGIARAQNEIIGWLNSDDFYLPGGGVVRALKYFVEHPEAGFVCGNIVQADEAGHIFNREGPNMTLEGLRRPWLTHSRVNQPGTLFRRAAFERCGPIDASLHYAMDFNFFLRAGSEFGIHALPVDIAALRIYGATKTSQGWDNFAREFQIILARYYRERGQHWMAWYAPRRVRLHAGHVLLMQSLQAEAAGDLATANTLRRDALRRNPFARFSYPNLCFRAQRLLGDKMYNRLRALFTGRRAPGPVIQPPDSHS